MIRCNFCSVEVNPNDRGIYKRVAGWETRAVGESRKSGSDIVLRESTGEVACATCINRMRLGVPVWQETLIS